MVLETTEKPVVTVYPEHEVAIKSEFLKKVIHVKNDESSTDESGVKTKRRKKNDVEDVKLCNSVANGKPCEKAACRFSHDLELYLAMKEDDLPGVCPSIELAIVCRFGVRCRFYRTHPKEWSLSLDSKEGLVVHQSDADAKLSKLVDLERSIRKKTTSFPKLDEFQKIMSQKPSAVEEADDYFIKLRPCERKKIDFRGKTYLAPLTTVGNLPFRRICKEYGVDVTCGEMALCSGITSASRSEWALLKRHESEDLFGIQLCGKTQMEFCKAAEMISQLDLMPDFVDLNLGCPIDLVFKKGMGSALMDRKSRLREIAFGLNHVLPETVGLTLKVRMGIESNNPVAHRLLPVVQSWNVFCAATIHGRSRQQRYTKSADWSYIEECAKACPDLPIIGNGDIFHWTEVENIWKTSQCSSIMIARGALIKPWIFTEIKERRHWDISSSERFDMLNKYAKYGLEHFGSDSQGVANTRRFLLEWCSFLYRYVPYGIIEVSRPQKMNERPPAFVGRDELETLMCSPFVEDWKTLVGRTMLGPTPEGFEFEPKHKANSYQTN